jgi:integrase
MGLLASLRNEMVKQSCLPNSISTYCWWVRKFYAFIRKPGSQWTGTDVERWMLHLHEQDYSAKSRKQALCALVFVFKRVLKADLGQLNLPPMPRERKTLKTIPTRAEIWRILGRLTGSVKLIAGLLYGAGLRVEECCKLRVHDLDIEALTVRIHSGKGDKSRLTVLPALIVPALRRHLEWRRSLHEMDLSHGWGFVELPGRLAQKYRNANREFRWQFIFPSTAIRDGHRWYITPEAVQKQMRQVVEAEGIIKRITPHTLRHAHATHSMRMGDSIETVRVRLGHESLETTATYLHADGAEGLSPLDVAMEQPLPSRSLDAPRAGKLLTVYRNDARRISEVVAKCK